MVENQKRKKICIAIHSIAHAGAERVATSWANYLAKDGHTVSVVVYAHVEDTYDLDERVRVVPLAESREQYFRFPKAKQLVRIRKTVRQENPEILISFLPKMQIYMMLGTLGMRLKRIETVRNNPWIDQDVGKKRFLWNLCFRRSDRIIVQTREQSQYFPEKLQQKCVVISNPIAQDFAVNRKVYDSGTAKKFVAVARLNPQKNYPMMIRAFAQILQEDVGCTLDIYGGGTQEQQQAVRQLIHHLGMETHIRLCGWRQDVSDLLPQYDAFLMSSDYEGMPNALAEAMAAGLVCLSTDCKTGPKDMIDDGVSGLLVKTGDVGAFAAGIRRIIQMDRQQCSDMGSAAREKILDMCSEKNTLERLRALLEADV